MQEVVTPTPKENEILVRVHAAPVNFGDLLARDFASVSPANSICRRCSGCPAPSHFRLEQAQKLPWQRVLRRSGNHRQRSRATKPGDAVYGCGADNGRLCRTSGRIAEGTKAIAQARQI